MSSRAVIPLSLLVLATAAFANENFDTQRPTSIADTTPVRRLAVDPPSTQLQVGDAAPNFSFLGPDGAWHSSSTIFAHGAVLLVFGAREEELRAIERERSGFHDAGVTPVMVLDMRSGSTASHARRLQLTGPIVADPRRAIAGLYNSLDQNTQRHAPAFFVVDEKGRIRSIGRGNLPSPRTLLAESERCLERDGANRSAVRD